jgi:hypothetical protein
MEPNLEKVINEWHAIVDVVDLRCSAVVVGGPIVVLESKGVGPDYFRSVRGLGGAFGDSTGAAFLAPRKRTDHSGRGECVMIR